MEFRGEIPWTDEDSSFQPSALNEHSFDVAVPGRVYHFTDYQVGAQAWVTAMVEARASTGSQRAHGLPI